MLAASSSWMRGTVASLRLMTVKRFVGANCSMFGAALASHRCSSWPKVLAVGSLLSVGLLKTSLLD